MMSQLCTEMKKKKKHFVVVYKDIEKRLDLIDRLFPFNKLLYHQQSNKCFAMTSLFTTQPKRLTQTNIYSVNLIVSLI